jgi:hypothetical protein
MATTQVKSQSIDSSEHEHSCDRTLDDSTRITQATTASPSSADENDEAFLLSDPFLNELLSSHKRRDVLQSTKVEVQQSLSASEQDKTWNHLSSVHSTRENNNDSSNIDDWNDSGGSYNSFGGGSDSDDDDNKDPLWEQRLAFQMLAEEAPAPPRSARGGGRGAGVRCQRSASVRVRPTFTTKLGLIEESSLH